MGQDISDIAVHHVTLEKLKCQARIKGLAQGGFFLGGVRDGAGAFLSHGSMSGRS